jgi:hypothetical protein
MRFKQVVLRSPMRASVIGLSVSIVSGLVLASCSSSQKKPEPSSSARSPAPEARSFGESVSESRVVNVEPGVAGGVVEDTTSVAVTVKAVDVSRRKVTLVDQDRNEATFNVAPEVRNLDQLRPGDKLTATLKERLTIYVRGDSSGAEKANDTYTAALASAPKGAKPGGVFAESYQVIATVTVIDKDKRTATLKFSDGDTRTVPVRSDVDLSRYKVGDSVIIRVTDSLSVLTSRP